MMKKKTEFLPFFYRVFALCGVVGNLAVWLAAGGRAGLSFALGLITIALIFVSWDLSTLRFKTTAPQTHWALETLLIFIRYLLLGGLFYAMMALFVVRWDWYLAGTCILVPSLLISTFLFREGPTSF